MVSHYLHPVQHPRFFLILTPVTDHTEYSSICERVKMGNVAQTTHLELLNEKII